MDEAIIAYLRKSYNLLIGEKTAEELKIHIGCIYPDVEGADSRLTMEARGRDVITGLPKSVTVSTTDMIRALEETIAIIVEGIKTTLENAPPELSADIVTNGIVLAGGGALIKGLDKLIEDHTGIKVVVAENALEAVAHGTGKSLEKIQNIRRYTARDKRF